MGKEYFNLYLGLYDNISMDNVINFYETTLSSLPTSTCISFLHHMATYLYNTVLIDTNNMRVISDIIDALIDVIRIDKLHYDDYIRLYPGDTDKLEREYNELYLLLFTESITNNPSADPYKDDGFIRLINRVTGIVNNFIDNFSTNRCINVDSGGVLRINYELIDKANGSKDTIYNYEQLGVYKNICNLPYLLLMSAMLYRFKLIPKTMVIDYFNVFQISEAEYYV